MKKSLKIPADLHYWWEKYAPYWHVCFTVIACFGYGLMWFHKTDDAVAQTALNTSDIVVLKENISVMKQEVHDIHGFLLGEKR